jgi:hypothetical protein
MSTPDLSCRDDSRRRKARTVANGIDYVEVSDDQRVLEVHFFGTAPAGLRRENVQITGGSRVPRIDVIDIRPCPVDRRDHDERLHIVVERPGDFSTYTLTLVRLDGAGRPTATPLPGFDPRYAEVRFSFKASCPSDLDCQAPAACPPPVRRDPDINYLAKDYASFRQLLLDRLAVVMPGWTERHVPDLGITLVELLAYVGDYLSYHQDAVATEAYLDTARQRISVRRHARLVDYYLHEGVNARAWIHIHAAEDFVGDHALDPANIFFISADDDVPALSAQVLSAESIRTVPHDRYEVFEPVDGKTKIALHAKHSEIPFYTWGNTQCCLPKGATRATLKDGETLPEEAPRQEPAATATGKAKAYPRPPEPEPPPPAPSGVTLAPGDYLLFEEVLGPETGNPADADRTRRHVVRLTHATRAVDDVERQPIVEIEWADEDALPFPLCLSAIVGEACKPTAISVARGNMVLVDHGRTIATEALGVVPRTMIASGCEGAHCPGEISVGAGRLRPRLDHGPLVFAMPFDGSQPASRQIVRKPDAREARPAIRVTSIPPAPGGGGPLVDLELFQDGNWNALASQLRTSKSAGAQYLRGWLGVQMRKQLAEGALAPAALAAAIARLRQEWSYRADLLGSAARDRHYTIEVDNDERAHLRFPDGEPGRRPEAGTIFDATYRIGRAIAGNVGAECISRIVFRSAGSGVTLRPRNPLPAVGGVAPETLAEAKLFAPQRFRTERARAITADDYAQLAAQHPKVQRAAAALQWTGNGYEALVAIDQRGRAEVEPAVLTDIANWLDPVRRIGHTVTVVPARLVPLYLKLEVCVLPHYARGHVKAAVLAALGNRALPDGGNGFFHPDNLTFGQSIFLSPIVAAVQAIDGVESVTVVNLERQVDGPSGEIARGVLPIGALEIARLDNDPSLPEHGRLDLEMRGGR